LILPQLFTESRDRSRAHGAPFSSCLFIVIHPL